jgi:hypothetical protein
VVLIVLFVDFVRLYSEFQRLVELIELFFSTALFSPALDLESLLVNREIVSGNFLFLYKTAAIKSGAHGCMRSQEHGAAYGVLRMSACGQPEGAIRSGERMRTVQGAAGNLFENKF